MAETSSQVSPPSIERQSPLSGPPLVRFQKFRRTCQMDANSTRGLLGSIVRSAAPAFSLLYRTCSQFLPPSVDLKHAALKVRAEGVTERADVDDVGVGRVNPDAGDVAGVLKSEVMPGTSGVVRPVHTVAVADVEADACLAHASVHD